MDHTTTNAIGLNYSDEWGKKIKVTGSYFFNQTNNDNNTDLKRQYITASDSGLVYNENSTTATNNMNHRLNARLEYQMDSNNLISNNPCASASRRINRPRSLQVHLYKL